MKQLKKLHVVVSVVHFFFDTNVYLNLFFFNRRNKVMFNYEYGLCLVILTTNPGNIMLTCY